jgi:H+/Cl- antiporter ClcA
MLFWFGKVCHTTPGNLSILNLNAVNIKQKRIIIKLKDQIGSTLKFNQFVFSGIFWTWVLLGIIGGAIAAIYWTILAKLTFLFDVVHGIWIIPFMTVAGLLAGLVLKRLGDPGEIDLIVDNIRFNGGQLNPKNNPSMILSSLICIAAGGSLGPEAPLVQVAGSTGTFLARKFNFKGEDIRTLTIASMASAFTALFGSPLGGSLFALEILHHKHVTQYYQALIPAIVASCSSYVIFLLFTHSGIGPVWNFPVYHQTTITDLGSAVLVSVVATAIGWCFISMVRQFKSFFKNLRIAVYFKLGFGGLLIGLIAYQFPLTRYFGSNEIIAIIHTDFSIQVLFAILVAKLLAISISVSSGWRGGFIIPLFFAGTTLGLIIHKIVPGQNPALVMVCCMAAINACVTRTPVSTTILLATMTGFNFLGPIIFASLTGFFLAPKTPFINAQFGDKEIDANLK